jgi:hypothetical protein
MAPRAKLERGCNSTEDLLISDTVRFQCVCYNTLLRGPYYALSTVPFSNLCSVGILLLLWLFMAARRRKEEGKRTTKIRQFYLNDFLKPLIFRQFRRIFLFFLYLLLAYSEFRNSLPRFPLPEQKQ